jgi:trans-2,3-dihydro-3-hydroxyanthranilate isomerase
VSELALHWLDVFTDRPFAGNPLAVVLDADALDDEQMQAIAAEVRLSETTFVLDGAERLRIFTPREELPLAGHPVVGTAVCLAELGRIASVGEHVFRTGVGETPVELRDGIATMTQAPLELRAEVDREQVATMLRIAPDEVEGHPRVATTSGIIQLFARLRNREVLARLAPDLDAIAAEATIDAVVPWCEDAHDLRQRAFLPRAGIPEDPATGSAAGALAALRVHEGASPGGVLVRQGEEIARPSEMHVTVGGAPGAPDPPRVGGRAVPVLEARLRI